jgi:hypothetical protein
VNNQLTCAESEISSKTRSLPDTVSHISPRVPFSSVKPAARASAKEREPFLSPICINRKKERKKENPYSERINHI